MKHFRIDRKGLPLYRAVKEEWRVKLNIRTPKLLMQQLGFTEEVKLEAQNGRLVIRPVLAARQGWEAEFQQMAVAGDEQLINGDFPLPEWEAAESLIKYI